MTTTKPITKTVLSAFVRNCSTLNLTQAKTLTDQLLAEYNVMAKPLADLSNILIEEGQEWLHSASLRIVRVTNVELGPRRVPNDPITTWGPESISWSDTANPASIGTTPIAPWLEFMTSIEPSPVSEDSHESRDQP